MNDESNSLLDAALSYAAHGWRVFPLADDDKVPITDHGYLDATLDPGQIRQWWSEHPDARVALSLRASGLVALDVDPRNDGTRTLAAAEAALGPLPRELVQQSGGGGLHLVFADPSPGPDGWTRTHKSGGRCRGKLDALGYGTGVDVKCNGYVVVEPSGAYRWLVLDLTPDGRVHAPILPARWCEALRKPEATLAAGDIDAWRAPCLAGPPSHDHLYAVRQALRDLGPRGASRSTTYRAIKLTFHDHGLTLDEGWPLLLEWDAGNGKPHGEALVDQVEKILTLRGLLPRERGHARAGLDDDEACGLAPVDRSRGRGDERAVETPQADSGDDPEDDEPAPAAPTRLVLHEDPPPAPGSDEALYKDALAEVQQLLGPKDGKPGGKFSGLMFRHAREILDGNFPPAPWLVRSLIADGGTAVIATEPKAAKTWAATEVAIAVATGTPAFGDQRFEARRRRVAYFYPEDVEVSVRNRLRALSASRGGPQAVRDSGLYAQPKGREVDLTRDEDVALLVASCRRIGDVGLLVLDPLRNVHSGEEDKSDAMAQVMARIRAISTLVGCVVLVVHHTAKSSRDGATRQPGQKMRGSGAIHGSVDSGIYLENLGGDGKTEFYNDVRSQVKSARGAGDFSLTLSITDDDMGQATAARWTVGPYGAKSEAEVGDGAAEKLPAVLDALYRRLGSFMTKEAVRDACKGGNNLVGSALKIAQADGLVEHDRAKGWRITPRGRATFEQRSED